MQLYTTAVGLAAPLLSSSQKPKDLAKVAVQARHWMYLEAAVEEAPRAVPGMAFIPGGENPHVAHMFKRPPRVVYAATATLPEAVVNDMQSFSRQSGFPTTGIDPLEGAVVIFQLFPKLCSLNKAATKAVGDDGRRRLVAGEVPFLEKLESGTSAKDVLKRSLDSPSSAFSEEDKQAATTYVHQFLPQGSAC